MTRAALLVLAVAALGCSTAEGKGEVTSERLYVEDCWNGKFSLDPTFFGANPYMDTQTIRIQRGDNLEEVSDGLIVLVKEVGKIRDEALGQPLKVGLPPGVSPPGVPIKLDPEPPFVHLSLYLHDTCHEQNGTLYSMSGSITFDALFSGDPNEESSDDRLTEARFSASFADPRHVLPSGDIDPERTSQVEGWFRFYFQRGQPAQPFP
ncbi:MAG: hypothetical protein HS104_31300 [Polyangiaceae bacterium]|nr:hypothetical protein [Polyangiaceae bacterium]MCE7892489.1 hypothetical protein [Sorangiineae bacterium PRO1]MCL4750758.1 hypothetical protein [Myxococcales bacterium]